VTERPPDDATFDEPIDGEALPSPGDLVCIRCTVAGTEGDDQPPRGVAIFCDADGDEVAVLDKLPIFGPDEGGRLAVRGTVLAVHAGAHGLRVRVSLAAPDGLALEDGRTEVDVALAQVERI
jgi:hypothetical protein